MKRILFIPWFCYKSKDLPTKIRGYDMDFFDDFESLHVINFDNYDYFLSHSLWSLYLWEFFYKHGLFDKYKNKTILYNPIVESNPVKISFKRIQNTRLFTTKKWLKLTLRFFSYFVFKPIYLFKVFKKVMFRNINKNILIYNQLSFNYLSVEDKFSSKYINSFGNICHIKWNHDEIYFNHSVLDNIIKHIEW